MNPSGDVSRRDLLKLLAVSPLAASLSHSETAVEAAATPQPAAGKWPVGLVSRHLQWTGLEQAIEIAKRIGFDEIEWNVRVGGHIPPDQVEKILPRAVELTRKAGLDVRMITTAIQDARSPFADAILSTAGGLGVKVYRSGEYFRYDYDRSLVDQLEALKPRMAGLAALNQKYGTTVAYHTHSVRGLIGGNIWDYWTVMRDLDPNRVGLNLDIGHGTARNGFGLIDVAHVVAPHIAAIAIKDFVWSRGYIERDAALRNREPGAQATWSVDWHPLGEGMVDFPRIFEFLKKIKFTGPTNIHFEHSNLLGTDVGTWKLDISEEKFVEIVGKDLRFVRGVIAAL
jgi:sugar phosphate isomerase/epimerase